MKYEKNQYTEGFSYCSLVIAGAFLYWGITSLVAQSWIGLLWLGIGLSILSGQYYALTNRKKLRNIILAEFAKKPNITIEEIQKNTGISFKDIKAIILDLKGSGELQGTFSSATGEMQLAAMPPTKSTMQPSMEQAEAVPAPEVATKKFCKQCGTQIHENEVAKYCPYCGSLL